MAQIHKEDVENIAKSIKKELTESEVQWILDNYLEYHSDNFLDAWFHIVEDMIYQVISNRK